MYKTIMGARTARQRLERSSDFELYMWFFMRISGLILLFIAIFHLMYMHFVIGVGNIDFNTIVGRWTGPSAAFWKTYDSFLLVFSFVHGTNGVRYVIEDYIQSQGWRVFAKAVLYLLFFVLSFMGAYVIFTFQG